MFNSFARQMPKGTWAWPQLILARQPVLEPHALLNMRMRVCDCMSECT